LNKADALAEFEGHFLGRLAVFDELTESESLFHRVDILALEVFGNHGLKCLFIAHLPDHRRNGLETVIFFAMGSHTLNVELVFFGFELAKGAVTTLSAHNLITICDFFAKSNLTYSRSYCDGLNKPLLFDVGGKFLNSLLIEGLSWIHRRWFHRVQWDFLKVHNWFYWFDF